MGLFEESTFALEKRDRSIAIILDGTNLDLASTHDERKANVFGMVRMEGAIRPCRSEARGGRGRGGERETSRRFRSLESQSRPCARVMRSGPPRGPLTINAMDEQELCILELSVLEVVLGSDMQHVGSLIIEEAVKRVGDGKREEPLKGLTCEASVRGGEKVKRVLIWSGYCRFEPLHWLLNTPGMDRCKDYCRLNALSSRGILFAFNRNRQKNERPFLSSNCPSSCSNPSLELTMPPIALITFMRSNRRAALLYICTYKSVHGS